MFKLIGFVVFIIFLYVGIYGWEEKNIEPFLLNIFKKENVDKTINSTTKVGVGIIEETSKLINN